MSKIFFSPNPSSHSTYSISKEKFILPNNRLDEVHNEVGRPFRVHMNVSKQGNQTAVDDVIIEMKKCHFTSLTYLLVSLHKKFFCGVWDTEK